MLVISQKKGDKIHIGRDITVTVIDIKANKVRLGIEAPNHLTILRDPLYQQEIDPDLADASHKAKRQAPEPNQPPCSPPQESKEDTGEDC